MNYIEITRKTRKGESKILWTNGGLGYEGKALDEAIEKIKNNKIVKSYKIIKK